MWFECTYKPDLVYGSLLYLKDEQSLYYDPWQKSDFTVLFGAAYVGLDVQAATGQVVQISGANPQRTWSRYRLSLPKAMPGHLLFRAEGPLPLSGAAVNYASDWRTFYDPERSCICMGDPEFDAKDKCVEFCRGIAAVLRGTELTAIWAKIKFV